jgi:uncharacterized protein (TIGR03435 family)
LCRSFLVAVFMLLPVGLLTSQSTDQAPKSETPSPIPQWQIDAGGKLKFDVVSIKQNKSGAPPSGDKQYTNVPLNTWASFTPTGGLFSATNFQLDEYIRFAYKLTMYQSQAMSSQLPKWATTNRYDVQARVAGNPNKDQFRLMMQSLLADRFSLKVHRETRQGPVFALVLIKPGKTGPQLQPSSPCDTPDSQIPLFATHGVSPPPCGVGFGAGAGYNAGGRFRVGARAMPMPILATEFVAGWAGNSNRPVLDETGLSGTFDFSIEFVPDSSDTRGSASTFQPDPTGPAFLDALRDQLGVKLERKTGPVESIIVDHIEQPSDN